MTRNGRSVDPMFDYEVRSALRRDPDALMMTRRKLTMLVFAGVFLWFAIVVAGLHVYDILHPLH